ncbi:MAG: hypothetical protein M3304_01140, partial [Actinomycetota bacterium]|nr:hypothetical protein [Actinomycetota bacterium]
MDWDVHAAREEARYADGEGRLADEPDARQRQLVRMAMAAGGAGLARVMQSRTREAAFWFTRSAERYRESYAAAPPGSWGRVVGAIKARLLARDVEGERADAAWAFEVGADRSESAIGRYAATLAALVEEDDDLASRLAASLLA